MSDPLDTSAIKDWRSIITLVVFVITNVIVLFPFHVPIYLPRVVVVTCRKTLDVLRIVSPQQKSHEDGATPPEKTFIRFNFPIDLVTAPLIADLFLLAILAIGREEVYDGTVGTDNIYPIEIMAFFITLAYIAISIDSSGLIRWLSFKVLQKGGKSGRLLYLYLYIFFFALATLIGNDPIVLSGTPFLAYMTRASSNIADPKAWIFTQFAVSNVASAILVSSNPTNLVLAGAFNIKFIEYTANIIVPVVVTAILLFPFLLFVLFRSPDLVPSSIQQHELPEEMKSQAPVNPNIPYANAVSGGESADEEQKQLILLEEIMNPYLDKLSAGVGASIMTAVLITILVLNASSSNGSAYPAYWITCPGAFAMFCWDLGYGWMHRHDTRRIARKGREQLELAEMEGQREGVVDRMGRQSCAQEKSGMDRAQPSEEIGDSGTSSKTKVVDDGIHVSTSKTADIRDEEKTSATLASPDGSHQQEPPAVTNQKAHSPLCEPRKQANRTTLATLAASSWLWARETFPTATTVVGLLPFKLVPFGLTMFVLVQALVTKGWVAVFAYGWEHWTHATGTMGAIVGMGFLSVVLCNFAGTNIGTTILLCRVIQAWEVIRSRSGQPISQRDFWASVYSMALGLNYGAFSTAFSASLAGLLWRDILRRKGIVVRGRDFVIVNFPIIAVAMLVGCLVLVGEVYIVRSTKAYDLG